MYQVQKGLPQEAYSIRKKVFIEEQGFEQEFDEIDDRASHVLLYDGGCAVGTARVFRDDTIDGVWHIGRVALLKEARAKHLGKALMRAAEEVAREEGAKVIEVSSQSRAQRFYMKCGYRAVGDEYMDEDCWHQLMVKRLDGVDHV